MKNKEERKNKMKTLKVIITAALILLISCQNTTEPTKQKLELGFEDASCTEVWLKLTGETGTELTLTRDDKEVEKFTLTTSPQTIRDDSLNPNTTYKYKITGDGETSAAEAATLDTTGNSFTWQTWNFGGDIGSCDLYDAAIIDENNIWAVGEILMPDTNENGYTRYNAVHWDGNEWELKRVFYPVVCGSEDTISYPSGSIIIFDNDEIWTSSTGDKIAILKNGNQTSKFCIPPSLKMSINKIWGVNNQDVYIVGNNGSIAHYQNGVWTKIETGTDLQFYDIYGSENSQTGKLEILAVCSQNYPPGKGIYSIEGNKATEISSNIPAEQIAELFGIWFIPERHYYLSGDGIYEKNLLSENSWQNGPLDITHYATGGIKANGLNDIFTAGAYGEVLHFNGVRWKSFINETGLSSGGYSRIAVKGNVLVAVGSEGQQAKILMGKR